MKKEDRKKKNLKKAWAAYIAGILTVVVILFIVLLHTSSTIGELLKFATGCMLLTIVNRLMDYSISGKIRLH